MKRRVKDLWVTALRSGEFEQGDGFLCKAGKYCCLGVLCELAFREGVTTKRIGDLTETVNYGHFSSHDFLPVEVQEWAGVGSPDIPINEHGTSAEHNDEFEGRNHVYSFIDIAELIERHVPTDDES